MLASEYILNCQKSLFRFEGLQDYSAMDGDRLVTTTPENNIWWQEMKERNSRGVITQRVRLVTLPLTGYTKEELVYLKKASLFSGDDIRIIEENEFKKVIHESSQDFWMIDEKYVFLMDYGSKGKFLKDRLVEGDEVGQYRDIKNILLNNSRKISEYVT